MGGERRSSQKQEGHHALALAMAGLLGQVGCVTTLLIVIALIAGLWLDQRFDTKPVFTLILLLGSVPVTIYLMVQIVLRGMARIQPEARSSVHREDAEEAEGGE